ncbi:MAG: glycosyltransferase family 2 protein [Cyanobacteria bacterium J06560_5]
MTQLSTKTPVVLLIYKRPSTTEKVFQAIREAAPEKLLIVANAPRPDNKNEKELCMAARSIVNRVDWDCEVLQNYADSYLSCKQRITSGLDWVFDNVDEAIILEDDCVPHPSFFRYCHELLDYYRHDERVMTIAGTHYQVPRRSPQDSYFFSRYNMFWGWATWRRAWKLFDLDMTSWPIVCKTNRLQDILEDRRAVQHWQKEFQKVYDGYDTWDWQWVLSMWLQSGLTIVPNTNLVSNIGFGLDSAHTQDVYDWRASMPLKSMSFPLTHPDFILQDVKADFMIQKKYYERVAMHGRGLERVRRKIWRAKKIFEESRTLSHQPLHELILRVLSE